VRALVTEPSHSREGGAAGQVLLEAHARLDKSSDTLKGGNRGQRGINKKSSIIKFLGREVTF